MRLRPLAVAGVVLATTLATPVFAHSGNDRRPGATQFDLEVRISAEREYGRAPRLASDSFGNVYAVARQELGAGVDTRSGTAARTASWRWYSADGGATWRALPASPGEADAKQPALRGDVATDDAGHVYVVDSFEADAALVRYRATALGAITYEGTAPLVATSGEDIEPSVAAHGDGMVFYLTGSTSGSPPGAVRSGTVAPREGTGYGPGRFAVYVSRDGGMSFDLAGYSLRDSDRCRITADRRRGSRSVYAACLDGKGSVIAYASHDDGATFDRYVAATYDVTRANPEAPAVAVDTTGAVHILRAEAPAPGGDRSRVLLATSRDGGRTWGERVVADDPFVVRHLSLVSSPDGRLGASMYIGDGVRWFVGGGIFPPNGKLLIINFADHTPVQPANSPNPPEGFAAAAFTPDSRLALAWTISTENRPNEPGGMLDHVWYVRSRGGPVDTRPDIARTPRYRIPPCTVPGQVTAVRDWQAIRAPAFRARDLGAGAALSAYAIDAYDPIRMYATNGTSVMRSDDGGCRWREVWSLETSPLAGTTLTAASARVTAVVMPDSRLDHRRVYLLLSERGSDGGTRPWVVRSDSGDAGTFALASEGLPASGRALAFAVSPANPDFVYLSVEVAPGRGEVFGTDDAGLSWGARTPLPPPVSSPPVTAFGLDPRVANNVWAVRDGRLVHSTDGARTWDGPTARADETPVSAIDVYHEAAQQARVLAWTAPSGGRPARTLESRDDGRTWRSSEAAGLPGPVESAAHGSRSDVVVVSTAPANDGPAGLFARDRVTGRYVDLSPVAAATPFRVTADRRARSLFYALTPTHLYRYAGSAIEPPPAPGDPDDTGYVDLDPPEGLPVVSPASVDLTLPVGDSAVVDYRLRMPALPRKLDVLFLTDTSESMTDALPVLRTQVPAALERLRASGIDVWAGVAQAKTDSHPPPYKRERDIGPLDAGVRAALARLTTRPAPGLETQLIGLDQAISGTGLGAGACAGRVGCLRPPVGSTCEVDPNSAGCAVPPGQQANFRDSAVKVVVHATDTTFRNPEGTPRRADLSIDIPWVAAKYAEQGVVHVGLAVHPDGVEDLAVMSALTGGIAPAGGLDCDGDGRADLRAGQPVVCRTAAGLDGVLRTLLMTRGVYSHVHFEAAAPSPVLRSVTPGEYGDVERTVVRDLAARAVFSCDGVAPGSYVARLAAKSHDGPAGVAVVRVTCVGFTVAPPRPRPVTPVPPVVVLVPPPVAPAPPAPNVNPQMQVQSQVQPQAGAATQDQEQPQVAHAWQEGERLDEEFAMSALPAAPDPTALMLAAAVLACAAGAYGWRSRTAPRLALSAARPAARRRGPSRRPGSR